MTLSEKEVLSLNRKMHRKQHASEVRIVIQSYIIRKKDSKTSYIKQAVKIAHT